MCVYIYSHKYFKSCMAILIIYGCNNYGIWTHHVSKKKFHDNFEKITIILTYLHIYTYVHKLYFIGSYCFKIQLQLVTRQM